MKQLVMLVLLVLVAAVHAGCVRVKTEVEPIDINVNVKIEVDRGLSDYFDDLDAQDQTLKQPDQSLNTRSRRGVEG